MNFINTFFTLYLFSTSVFFKNDYKVLKETLLAEQCGTKQNFLIFFYIS